MSVRRSSSSSGAEPGHLADPRWQWIDERVAPFEQAWQQGARPRLEEFLPRETTHRLALLVELVHVELEFRFRAGESPRVEEYLDRFADLQTSDEIVADLVRAEFEWRQRGGEQPAVDEYVARFPALADRIAAWTKRATNIDEPPDAFDANPPHEPTGRLGRFELLRRLGSGAFGTVYQARDPQLERLVAIKILPTSGENAMRVVERWLREARSTARLTHDGIVPLYEVGQADGACYLVSEYVSGPTLAALSSRQEIPFRRAAEFVRDVALALEVAHRAGIVHRDVKPSNIMIDEHGRPRLTDFGLAKLLTADASQTLDGHLLGTPAYMSPEQAQGLSEISPTSDVYSLGVVLYELLTGQLPFAGHWRSVLRQLLNDDPRPPRKANARIPRDLETICLQAMSRQPARRYRSAAALADDLTRFLQDESIAARPPGWPERVRRSVKRHPTTAVLVTAALVGVVAAVVGMVWHVSQLTAALDQAHDSRLAADAESERAGALQRLAEARERRVRDYLRAADLKLAHEAWQNADLGETLRLVDRHQDDPRHPHFPTQLLHKYCRGEQWTALGHQGDVYCVDFSPAGELIATGGQDGTVRLWAIESGKPLAVLAGHTSDVNSVAFSPNGAWLASASDDGTVRLWNPAVRAAPAHRWQLAGSVFGLAFSPDGRRLAWGDREGRITMADVDAPDHTVAWLAHDSAVESLAYSPDGSTLASAGGDGRLCMWNLADREMVWEARHEYGMVVSVDFSPDGRSLVSGGQDRAVRLWDAATCQPTGELIGHREQVQSVAFSPDGRNVISGGKDRTARLWQVTNSTTTAKLRGHVGRVWQVAYSPDGRHIATTGSDGALKLWSPAESFPARYELDTIVRGVAFSTASQVLLACTPQSASVVGDNRQDANVSMLSTNGSGVVSCTASPAWGERFAVCYESGIVELRSRAEPEQILARCRHAAPVIHLASDRDTRWIALADDHRQIFLWTPASGEAVRAFASVPFDVAALAVSPDAQQILIAGRDGSLAAWDAQTGECTAQLTGHTAGINTCVFDSSGELLVTASDDRTWRAWDVKSWQPLATFQGSFARITSLAISPCDTTLATGDVDGNILLWDLTTHQQLFALHSGGGSAHCLQFSPDGRCLVASVWQGSTSQLVVWDTH